MSQNLKTNLEKNLETDLEIILEKIFDLEFFQDRAVRGRTPGRTTVRKRPLENYRLALRKLFRPAIKRRRIV